MLVLIFFGCWEELLIGGEVHVYTESHGVPGGPMYIHCTCGIHSMLTCVMRTWHADVWVLKWK